VGDRERVVFVHACVHVLLIVACNASLSFVYVSVRNIGMERETSTEVERDRYRQRVYILACLRACKMLVFEWDTCVCLYLKCRWLNGHVHQPFCRMHWHN